MLNKKKKNAVQELESREDIEKARRDKAKRPMILVFVFAIVIFIAVVLITAFDNYKAEKAKLAARKDAAGVELNLDNFGLWQSVQEEKMEGVQRDIKDLNENMSLHLKDGLNRVTKELNASVSVIAEQTSLAHKTQMEALKKTKEELDSKIVSSQNDTIKYVNRRLQDIGSLTASNMTDFEIQPGALAMPIPKNENQKLGYGVSNEESQEEKTIEISEEVSIETDEALAKSDVLVGDDDNTTEKPIEFHIPMGLTTGTIITGVNAPIFNFGGTNDTTSNPIYISLDKGITIANQHHLRSEECLLLGSAAGELSDERAKIILNKISCIFTNSKNGKTYKVEDKIDGWVYGEDGITGLKGRLITQEGKIISTALPLTVLETALTYIEEKAKSSTTVVPNGSLDISSFAAQGANDGGSQVLDKLSDIYIKYLDSLDPIISVLPGRTVTVAFKGTSAPLVMKEFKGLDVAYFEQTQGVDSDNYYNYDLISGDKYYE